MTIAPDEIAHWRSWTGRTETREERLDADVLRRYAAALGESLDVETNAPSLAHWAFFLPIAAASEIGPDGHPKRGGFLPPVSLARRMFAASEMLFHETLTLGEVASRTSTVMDVAHKPGRSGELVLVRVEHRIAQSEVPRVTERQTIVYRDAGAVTAAIIPVDQQAEVGDAIWTPGSVDLFRFSAVTFNSHRIHYDLPYAVQEEGYPGLVVHGPFTAARLFARAARKRAPKSFGFRAVAPMFTDQPIRLTDGAEEGAVVAIRCDGATGMTAHAGY